MSYLAIIILLVLVAATIFVVALLLDIPLGASSSAVKNNLDAMVESQRETFTRPGTTSRRDDGGGVLDIAAGDKIRVADSRLTMRKRLKYAQWPIPPAVFHLIEIAISITAFFLAGTKLNMVMQFFALLTGPLFMRWLLNIFLERRFGEFDTDYSPFLLSLVGLLKTGMNVMPALEAAAQGLEEGCLVRQEVEVMMERLRMGVPEDRSIGAFGDDVFHPEIELFVQALLLSRRVGGTLSETLDRLARQVRRRQYFRKSAKAAVGMQRGSIWLIIGILAALELYLYFVYPQAVVGAIKDPFGWEVWQFGIMVMLLGIFWVRQVTKIKV